MKRLFGVFLGLFLTIVSLSPAKAIALSQNSSGQTAQYYSVVFDKEQEAAVSAKLTYYNRGKDELKELVLQIPGTSTRIISVVQEKLQAVPTCIKYDYNASKNQDRTYPCLEWDTSSSSSGTYILLDFDASKIQNTGQAAILNLALREPIASQASGTIILYYKTNGFATKVWNGNQYTFETIKSNYDIDFVRVAIDVADELYIKKTAKSETNYQANDISKATGLLSVGEFRASAPLSQASSYIQTTPGVVEETKSLDPNENFRVEGKYYNSSWMGELPTIVGVGITFLIIVIVLLLIIKSEKKKV